MRQTVEDIYNKLINDDMILTKKGRITFSLGNIDIIVKQRDVVGNIMQEWIEGWLKKNNIEYALNNNSQMPPDFYLNPENKTEELMEIKAFNYKAGPGFDIADFRMYEQEIALKPWMLNVTYLIFGYDMSDEGIVTIKKVWIKKVWEISRPMKSGKKRPYGLLIFKLKKEPSIRLDQPNGTENLQNSPLSKILKTSCQQWKKPSTKIKTLMMTDQSGFLQSSTTMKSTMASGSPFKDGTI